MHYAICIEESAKLKGKTYEIDIEIQFEFITRIKNRIEERAK